MQLNRHHNVAVFLVALTTILSLVNCHGNEPRCGDKVLSSTEICCGNTPRDPGMGLCCNDVWHDELGWGGLTCCGKSTYTTASGKCCGDSNNGNWSFGAGFECCGTTPYHIDSDKCCQQASYPFVVSMDGECDLILR